MSSDPSWYDDAPIPIRKEDFVRRIVQAAIPGRIWAEEEPE